MKTDYFFIYETTNLVNNMKYRGIHKTKKINDNYLGSGSSFVNAIKKYGKENFKREILEFCDSYDELLEREKFFVDEEWVKNRTNYNTKTGGQSAGILSEESRKKISNSLKEKYKKGEIVAKIGEWNKENGSWCKGLKMTDEFKEKCSIAGKKRFENDKNHPLKIYGNINSPCEETKNKISKTLKEQYKNGERIANHDQLSEEHKNKISESLYIYYKNEEHHSKGKPSWNKGKIMEKIECTHCGKMIDKSNAIRWHFDNCKLSSSYKKPEYKKMSEGQKEKISKILKEKYKYAEHHSKGKPSWNKGKIMEKIECPHCKKISDKSNAIRWHFDNCKFKPL